MYWRYICKRGREGAAAAKLDDDATTTDQRAIIITVTVFLSRSAVLYLYYFFFAPTAVVVRPGLGPSPASVDGKMFTVFFIYTESILGPSLLPARGSSCCSAARERTTAAIIDSFVFLFFIFLNKCEKLLDAGRCREETKGSAVPLFCLLGFLVK